MQINNKLVIVIIISIMILFWYVKNTKDDISRYRNIIDKYMTNNKETQDNNKNVKSLMKKVRFNTSERN